ncbi:hypothetical protein EUZ85_09920 [Hahella sp. KA22]|uniref:FOG: TPR repeat n=1 Tax=Hahella chejuensis (strain KCTC 2396) TaxID=349521 RepID=Q2SC19_HAHCH|nr:MULTISPECIES: hypothetical protein [Hahella]ABC31805.1 hypothetical protein HCH_05124 [Hahella chejuensis KCTC 2396]AZZ91022.1 hypothetical protein ENC22_07365 [Hahella sp. KA22]QAY54392.1 hypothetical protein EUZ85_09920 [Hahella sp. KA22]
MLYPENLIKRVSEIGVLACEQGRLQDAEVIFGGVAAIADDVTSHTAAGLGMAATKIAGGDFESGVKLLSDNLAALDYENMDALALLVFAMKRSGRTQDAEELIPRLTSNPDFKGSLAEEILLAAEG